MKAQFRVYGDVSFIQTRSYKKGKLANEVAKFALERELLSGATVCVCPEVKQKHKRRVFKYYITVTEEPYGLDENGLISSVDYLAEAMDEDE